MGNRVARRLESYWRLEAANAVIVPLVAIVLVLQYDGALTLSLGLSAAACAALLVIGAIYWRGLLRRLQGAPGFLASWLPWLGAARWPSLILALAAVVATAAEFLAGEGGWTSTRIAAVGLSTLAILEYVNYYEVQLQHFDNWADFRRLITGKGFRRAHLARELDAWRASGRRF